MEYKFHIHYLYTNTSVYYYIYYAYLIIESTTNPQDLNNALDNKSDNHIHYKLYFKRELAYRFRDMVSDVLTNIT